jgi:orotate phosphoribosyltransferase
VRDYQKELINLMLASGALAFGNFTLKSGRKSPYFINTGRFSNNRLLARIGSCYARHLIESGIDRVDCLFGPAYKGIPLAVATAVALDRDYNYDVEILFDRKETKDHGEAGLLVGQPLRDGQRVAIVEDVITAGTTLQATIPFLRAAANVVITAVLLLVDRCEKGQSNLSAVEEIDKSFGVRVAPILTIYDIVDYLKSNESTEYRLTPAQISDLSAYLKQYAPRSHA